MIASILLFLALVSFALAAFGWPATPRVNLIGLGLALWVLSLLLPQFGAK